MVVKGRVRYILWKILWFLFPPKADFRAYMDEESRDEIVKYLAEVERDYNIKHEKDKT